MFLNSGKELKQQKSIIQQKNFRIHYNRSIYEKEKKRKTIRFELLMKDVFSKKLQDYKQIINLDQAKNSLREMIKKNDLVRLTYSIIDLQNSTQLKLVLDAQFLQQLIQFSQNSLYRPQIVYIYKYLSQFNESFSELIYQKNWSIFGKIVREAQSLKQSQFQTFYLQILENLMQKCSKRWQERVEQNFDIFIDMVENFVIPFENGLSVLKAVCPFITKKRHFQTSTVKALIEFYQRQANKGPQITPKMIDCYFVLTKVIHYQQNCEIITNFRMMKMLCHALANFPGKIIEQYYNVFNLLSILIKKTKQNEQVYVTRNDFKQIKQTLVNQYECWETFNFQNSHEEMMLTDMVLEKVFQNEQIFNIKIFDITYLNLISNFVGFCNRHICMDFFIRNDFFIFLENCIDHISVEIKILSLEIIAKIANQTNSSHYLEIINTRSNLITILGQKISYHPNEKVIQLTEFILQRFSYFKKH